MDNSTADIARLPADLPRVVSRFANITGGTSGPSNDLNPLTSTFNRLALSALAVALVAFITAVLQTTLEYTTSGESARRLMTDPCQYCLSDLYEKMAGSFLSGRTAKQ
ncbi:hypothetical protein F4780DRAFT_436064 [Xylariomycetidae sp. FL0641]|nr:hypothetical protein F4780DRAFT_436064 [Xylariomycetidae sp. FL0641]